MNKDTSVRCFISLQLKNFCINSTELLFRKANVWIDGFSWAGVGLESRPRARVHVETEHTAAFFCSLEGEHRKEKKRRLVFEPMSSASPSCLVSRQICVSQPANRTLRFPVSLPCVYAHTRVTCQTCRTPQQLFVLSNFHHSWKWMCCTAFTTHVLDRWSYWALHITSINM